MPPRKRTSPARERWVPAGLGKGSRPAPDRSSGGSGKPEQDTDEWLVPDAARPAKKRTRSRPKRTGPKKARQAARPKPKERRAEDQLADLSARLAEAERRAEQAAEREKELREQHARELTELREQLATAKKRTTGKRRSAKYPKSPKSRATPAVDNGQRLDINTVEFDELRALGLTVAQSARVIATRDARMGFKSLKELDDLPDLSSDVVSTLKQWLQV